MKDFLSPQDEGFIALHAMYVSLRKAGFGAFTAALFCATYLWISTSSQQDIQ